MAVVLKLIPAVTINNGGTSNFGLSGTATPSDTSVSISPSAFTIYGAAFVSPSSEPTASAIELGTSAVSTANANAINNLTFNGLTAGTTYDFYIVGKDANSEYTAVSKITATTTDVSITISLSLDLSNTNSNIFPGLGY